MKDRSRRGRRLAPRHLSGPSSRRGSSRRLRPTRDRADGGSGHAVRLAPLIRYRGRDRCVQPTDTRQGASYISFSGRNAVPSRTPEVASGLGRMPPRPAGLDGGKLDGPRYGAISGRAEEVTEVTGPGLGRAGRPARGAGEEHAGPVAPRAGGRHAARTAGLEQDGAAVRAAFATSW